MRDGRVIIEFGRIDEVDLDVPDDELDDELDETDDELGEPTSEEG